MDSDVDAWGLEFPDTVRDKEADFTGETGILVLLFHLVFQSALDAVEVTGHPRAQDHYVYTWKLDKTKCEHASTNTIM